ncbi:hypothetical protein ACOSP7_017442 [Xanthoceras sorbifolium]
MSTSQVTHVSSQVSHVSDKDGVVRPTAHFPPDIWGDRFLNYNSEVDEIDYVRQDEEIEELKDQVRMELLAIVNHSLSEQINLVDIVERLGVERHFETEIEQVLQHIYDTYYHDIDHQYDLCMTALSFRLLRQHGHYVSSDIFNKFIDGKGNFKESLTNDVLGMLSLYEAAQLEGHGKDILDKAIVFTTAHLQSMAMHLSNPYAAKITHVLKWPIHKAVQRIESRRFFSIYQDQPSHNQALLRLAKLDFNLLQSLHKKELCQLSIRWKNSNFVGKLPFARNRLVECYFWILGMYNEPYYAVSRRILVKGAVILTILYDIYDAYGTPDELKLFTEAVERWDVNCMDQLPEYMQFFYKAILDHFDGIEEELAKKGCLFRLQYGKEAVKMMTRAYYEESKWLRDNRSPSFQEYMRVALVSVGYAYTIIMAFATLDCCVTKEALDWALSRPRLITASELMLRLLEDVRSYKFERQRTNHIPSSVECYIKEYGVSEQEAYAELNKQINDSWKDINEECLNLTQLPRSLVKIILDFTRMTHVMYDGDDNFTRVGKQMQAYIASLLIDPVPI